MTTLLARLRKTVTPRVRYRCPSCERKHEGFPAPAYAAPDEVFALTGSERGRATVSQNLCVLDDDRHFIRCVLNVEVEGWESEFSFGPWIEVDRTTFHRYAIDLDGNCDDRWDGASGRLANAFPAYSPGTLGLACTIRRASDSDQRPVVEITDKNHLLGIEQTHRMEYAHVIEVVSHMKGFLLIVD